MIAVVLAAIKYWRLILVVGVIALVGAGILYVKHLQSAAATAKAHLAAETLVAENNRHAAEALVAHQKQMERLRATVTAAATKRTTAVTAVIEGITHEPTLQAPSATDLDALGDKLRSLETNPHS